MRRPKLTQHCIEEQSDELAMTGAILGESIFFLPKLKTVCKTTLRAEITLQ